MMVSWRLCRIHTFRTDEGMTANMNQRMGAKISTRLEKGIIHFTCISFFEFLFLLVRSGSYYLLPRILGSPLNRFPFFSLSLPQFIPKQKARGNGKLWPGYFSAQNTSVVPSDTWNSRPSMTGLYSFLWSHFRFPLWNTCSKFPVFNHCSPILSTLPRPKVLIIFDFHCTFNFHV